MRQNLISRLLGAYGLLARKQKHRFYIYIGVLLAALIFGHTWFLVQSSSNGTVYDAGTLDLAIQYRFNSPAPSPDILIVDIDERSLSILAEDYGRWPWPRDIHAELLAMLVDSGVKAVAFNIMFSDPDLNNPDADSMFNLISEELSEVVYPITRLSKENDSLSEVKLSMIDGAEFSSELGDRSISVLFPYFSGTHDKLGANNLLVDDDGVVRRAQFYLSEGDIKLPTMHGKVASIANESGMNELSDNQWLLNWRNKSEPYARMSFADLYNKLVVEEDESVIAELEDKILVVGVSAPGISVLKGTALGPNTDDNEIIATAIDDLVNGTGLKTINPWIVAIISFMFLAVMVFLFSRGLSSEKPNSAFVVLELMAVAITLLSISYTTYVVDLSPLIISGLTLFAIIKVHQNAEKSARTGVGAFKSPPGQDFTYVYAVYLYGADHKKNFEKLETEFGFRNVFEVEELLSGESILTEFFDKVTYALILAKDDSWDAFLKSDAELASGGIKLISRLKRTDEYSVIKDLDEEIKIILLDVVADCFEHYVLLTRQGS